MTGRSLFRGTPAAPAASPPAVPPAADLAIETAEPRAGSADAPFSVTEISRVIQETFEDRFPRSLWVEGELSQVGRPRSGHLFLTFREGNSTLEAVMWASEAKRLAFVPSQGDRVRALGRLGTYAGKSHYRLQIQRLEKTGLGALLQELLERERRLEREGLFAPARKRPLPFLPRRIGLLTASGSDAWADFTRAARARFPGVRIVEHFAPVQGAAAPAALVTGIRALGRKPLDVIVVARGGGSFEDLLAFSDEAVVRAAADCRTPLVSAVGHDQDRPLLDRVADFRAATPSAAAREILPAREELLREVEDRRNTAGAALRRFLQTAGRRVAGFGTHRATTALPQWIEGQRQERRNDRAVAREAVQRAVGKAEARLRAARQRLDAASPARGLAEHQRQLGDLRVRLGGLPLLRTHEERLAAARRRLEAASPARGLAEHQRQLGDLRVRLGALPRLRAHEERLAAARQRLSPEFLERLVAAERAALSDHRTRQRAALQRALDRRAYQSAALGQRLEALDPRRVLRRGYSLALDAGGRAIRSSAGVRVGDPLRLLLGEGELGATVSAVRPAAGPPDAPEET